MKSNEVTRYIGLIDEVDTGFGMIREGLCQVIKLSRGIPYHLIIFLLLSNGFERIIKCLIVIHRKNQKFTDEEIFREMMKIKHGLKSLNTILISILEEQKYAMKSSARNDDVIFLIQDMRLQKMLELFDQFGQGGRYYNLDLFIKGSSRYEDPKNIWNDLIEVLIQDHPEIWDKLMDPKTMKEGYHEMYLEFIKINSQYARSLARLFTLADFGEDAQRVSSSGTFFRNLRDEDIGKIEFCLKC